MIRDHLQISLLLLSELSELIVYYTPLNHQKTVDFTYGLKPAFIQSSRQSRLV